MCLLVLAWQAHPRFRLIVGANRDEFHERPAAPFGKWSPPDDFLAGRDLQAGGTWLGLDRLRRFAVVTNFRDLQRAAPEAPSRGGLIPGYLGGSKDPQGYLADLEPRIAEYSGFNLLLADSSSLWYASNRSAVFARALTPGVYGLSNELLDTPWPKLQRVRRRFEAWLAAVEDPPVSELFAMLADDTRAGPGEELPSTGLSPEWEQILSSPFVRHPKYGTRCSTVLLLTASGAGYVAERRFSPAGLLTGESQFRLEAGAWP